MGKFLELFEKAVSLYGPIENVICSNNTCPTATPTPLFGYTTTDFKIYARYESNRIYQGYKPNMIPEGVDRILYGYIQYGNCEQSNNQSIINTRWEEFSNNNMICNSNYFATGNNDIQIYSNNPYSDFISWPPNAPETYNQAGDHIWGYHTAYKGVEGLNNLGKIASKTPVSLSIGGPSGTVQLLAAMLNQDASQSMIDFYTEFLPSAMSSPFVPIKTSHPKNIDGLDIFFEPYYGTWNYIDNQISDLTDFVMKMSNISEENDIFTNLTLSANGFGGAPVQINYAGRYNLTILFSKIDNILLNTYNYKYTQDLFNINFLNNDYYNKNYSKLITNCHSPLFYDKTQDKFNDLFDETFFPPSAFENIHGTIYQWKNNIPEDQMNKIFIGASLYGKEVSNIVADNITDSLYKIFNITDSNIIDSDYNDNSIITPLNAIDNGFGSSIVSRINAGILKEEFNINAGCAYAYDITNHNFVSYDNELSLIMKICYIIHMGLGGIVFSDIGADKSNKLINLAIDIRENFVNYCKSDYTSQEYPGIYDFSFDHIDRLINMTESSFSVPV